MNVRTSSYESRNIPGKNVSYTYTSDTNSHLDHVTTMRPKG